MSLVVSLLTLMSPALAGAYDHVEGDIFIRLDDASAYKAVRQEGAWYQSLGATFASRDTVLEGVCSETAIKIKAALNSTAKPEEYVPSTATCEHAKLRGGVWYYWRPEDASPEVVTLPASEEDIYYVRVHVTDYQTPTENNASRAKVAAGRALGYSIEGRVNAKVVTGVAETMELNGYSFYFTFEGE